MSVTDFINRDTYITGLAISDTSRRQIRCLTNIYRTI